MTDTDTLVRSNATYQKQLHRVLMKSRIFGDLNPELITELSQVMTFSVISGGEQLFAHGDESSCFYFVVSGRLLASIALPDGNTKRLSEIGPGASVGELGLILQQPRAANIVAIRDSTLAKLSRSQFDQLLNLHPVTFNRAITRTVYEYSLPKSHHSARLGATTLAIISLNAQLDIAGLCLALEQEIEKDSRIHHITADEGAAFYGGKDMSQRSNERLSELEQTHDYLIFEVSDTATPWAQLVTRQADQLILIADADTRPEQLDAAQAFIDKRSSPLVRKSLVLLHENDASRASIATFWHKKFDLERIYPIRRTYLPDISRLARFITDRAVGLVLGGGGARGLAHIGVLQALHESGIAVDMICGNSMGALIGAQYANGTKIDDLLDTTRRFIRGGEHPTLPLLSLLSGQRMRRDLKLMFADAKIEALWCPFFAVSCNLTLGKLQHHDQGDLWQAILASNSPAGIVPPVLAKGELLVDAAILDNVPVAAMRKKLGLGIIIAVDVDVHEDLSVDAELEQLSVWQLLYQRLFGGEQKRLPGIMDLLNRASHVGGLGQREANLKLADHYLQPQLGQFSMLAYGKGEKIVATGYQYCLEQMPSLKKLIVKQ